MMHLLFLSQVLPYPLDAGPKMRSYYVLRYLAQKHQVTLLTFVRPTDRPEHIAHLAEFCHSVHTVPMHRSRLRDVKFLVKSLLTRQSFIIIRDEVPAMTNVLTRLVNRESFDVIHADQLWMAQYALAAGQPVVKTPPKLILDQHNAVHLIPRRLIEGQGHPIKKLFLAREANLLTAYELEVCRRFDHVVWVTQEDRQAVNALSPSAFNGQPYQSIIPICADPMQVEPIVPAKSRVRITFLGGLHWPPNAEGVLWFAKEVFPLVQAEIPEAVLTVIGKSPPAGLDGAGVEVTGYVADLKPYLAETVVFIVPLHAGGGMRVKILDAWSWGLPIVSTTIGAEGIETEHEENILIADTAQTFATATIRVFKDWKLAQKLEQNGRQTVVENYNWRITYAAWDEVYGSIGSSSGSYS